VTDAVRALHLSELPTEEFNAFLKAPCGSRSVHLVGVDVLQGDHVTEVRRETKMRRAENPGRGSVLIVRFYDEDGHTFHVTARFHKGAVYVDRSECVPYPDMPDELWRD